MDDMRQVLTEAKADIISASKTLMVKANAALDEQALRYKADLVTEGVALAPSAYQAVYRRMASAVIVDSDVRTAGGFRAVVTVRVPATGAFVVGRDGKPVPIGKVSGGYEFGAGGGNLYRDQHPRRSHHASSEYATRFYHFLTTRQEYRVGFNIGLHQFPPSRRKNGWWIMPTFDRMEPRMIEGFTADMNTAIGEVR